MRQESGLQRDPAVTRVFNRLPTSDRANIRLTAFWRLTAVLNKWLQPRASDSFRLSHSSASHTGGAPKIYASRNPSEFRDRPS